jgi:hypothetical protein
MPRINEISDKFFNRDDADMTLAEFTSNLIDKETQNMDVGVKVTSPLDFVVNGEDVSRLLIDSGTGRIYDGLKSLELMSRIINGASASSSSLFDAEIIAFNADDMRAATNRQAYNIVNVNLGVKDILDYAKSINSPETAAYEEFVSKIARQIKAGGFKTEDHLAEALVRVKALVKSVLADRSTK